MWHIKTSQKSQKKVHLLRILSSVLVAVAALLGAAVPAQAETAAPSTPLTLMVQNTDGTWTPVDLDGAGAVRNPDAGAPIGPAEQGPSPMLIDFNQWTACWVQNKSTAVFATYSWLKPNSTYTNVTLQCGNNSYGYKHIVAQNHDDHWNAKLTAAKNAGWDSQNYRVYTWDDLMHIVTASLLGTAGGYYSENSTSQKACRNGSYGLWSTQTHQLVYTFRAEAVWSMNNKRIITSYPSSRQVCNA
ncbi:hypothetical protein [Leucobacter triazinivorans]|uniref:DUF2599 domain-containing protein n=1 Tax=Leucobacter triazinivorans TaxID=1784719 RepID=A0A4P6KBD8_9MICO|nr:hypothetical protein [Leucobacter triazinivorans]QBE47422.1 hypothetical protein EVS81_00015 [Leucobacter triazinivorans]